MKFLLQLARFALVGAIAGISFTVLVGLIWPTIFPGIVASNRSTNDNALALQTSIYISLLVTLIPSLIGGAIGGFLPREGGRGQQNLVAAIGGILLSLPFGCFNYWLLSVG